MFSEKAFAEQLVAMTVQEVNELGVILQEEYGIEPAAAAVAVASKPQPVRKGFRDYKDERDERQTRLAHRYHKR